MKYAVDRIENDIAVLQNIETGEIINISIMNLPEGVKEKDILKYENSVYILDNNEKLNRLNIIKAKMKMLKEMAKK